MDHMELMQGLTDQERLSFQTEYGQVAKKPSTGLLLTLFLGAFGAHRFYLEQVGWGIGYTLFFWTGIPVLAAFVELFLIMNRVREFNRTNAARIRASLLALRANRNNNSD